MRLFTGTCAWSVSVANNAMLPCCLPMSSSWTARATLQFQQHRPGLYYNPISQRKAIDHVNRTLTASPRSSHYHKNPRPFSAVIPTRAKHNRQSVINQDNAKIHKGIYTAKSVYAVPQLEKKHVTESIMVQRISNYRGPEEARFVSQQRCLSPSPPSTPSMPGTARAGQIVLAALSPDSFRSGSAPMQLFVSRPGTPTIHGTRSVGRTLSDMHAAAHAGFYSAPTTPLRTPLYNRYASNLSSPNGSFCSPSSPVPSRSGGEVRLWPPPHAPGACALYLDEGMHHDSMTSRAGKAAGQQAGSSSWQEGGGSVLSQQHSSLGPL